MKGVVVLKKIVLLFLLTSIPFGLAMWIIFFDFKLGVYTGIFFGSLMTLLLGIMHLVTTRKEGGSFTHSVKQKCEIQVQMNYEDVYQICLSSFNQLHRVNIVQQEKENGLLVARTRMSLMTWGENVTIHILEAKEEELNITIQSTPFLPTTIGDYGRNYANVRSLSTYIEQEIHKTI
ncbi:hypothetical protein Q75_00845 [Bacillus coahuilensis p1.1.43]|uniref:Uncharacterized protein n=1 Tax=Bacillus coahuilensis p1.1.43 TaxID=1150625 RepID=A0A147KC80_9BACI|nr:hypothetical protein Q75_00845 [Bacillus coahuilensis p1.1.43]